MFKKITTNDTNFEIVTSTADIVEVGTYKFAKDERYPWIDIFLIGNESDEFLEQIDGEKASKVIDLEDLKIFALNWIFENVKVVKSLT